MKWFVNLSTRSKLFFAFGLLFAILLAAILAAYASFTGVQMSQREMYRRDFLNAVRLLELRSAQNRTRADILEMMITGNREKELALEEAIKSRAKSMDELTGSISEVFKAENKAQPLKKLEELKSTRDVYAKTRERQISLIYAGKVDEARRLSADVQRNLHDKIREIAQELGDAELEQAKGRVAAAETRSRNLQITFLIAGTLAFVLSLLTIIAMNRIIAVPLKEISRVAERIAAGDLSVNVASGDRRDEVGALTGSLGAMIDGLRSITKEIQESVSVLASSASEILSSTTEVASSVTETATSVNETTTTVEEVKQTAHVSSQKAKYVSEASQNAVQISQTGRRAVDEMVEKMNRIRQQMEFIAESVVRLSEQSQAIGEIIATVNDLAEQSNLLAVNASIEAAKAGEQGKGFAVVAQEVRSLAEQSKQATAQIRGILNEIQKATSAAVLATERGSKTVDEGVEQSAQAGESIKTLASSITEAAQAATQISASSQQQLVGMEQVIAAMNNIKLATEQNVEGTKQTESAAHSIHELGQKLKTLVARYKV